MTKELLTIPEFCEAVSCGRTHAYKLISTAQLPAVKQGKRTLIRREDMLAWIKSLRPYSVEKKEG
ncbi:MAG TPA: helix-turn-helix domain-containing protein [Alphaproteobacteria bacterium]|jgi:excisionase family DNA binding protein|nr:helix-turn-helix domain-containing protein [Alphaproteobacteria bacterium]MDY0029909.1 helix-turn-helix domain-containing protein [Pseudobdellovibrionaceae bacterium]HOO49701.1 helix-turn-helix domain-containing protein [Alphaproteobacteria bacterium]